MNNAAPPDWFLILLLVPFGLVVIGTIIASWAAIFYAVYSSLRWLSARLS